MKKKLVSILLSLSMCAAYATPLATVAAEKAPAEDDVAVVETVVPNAKVTEKEAKSTSTGAFDFAASGSGITVEYNDSFEVGNYNCYKATGSWTQNDKLKSEVTNQEGPTLELAKSSDSDYLTIAGNKITAKKRTKNNAKVPIIISMKGTKDGFTETAQLKVEVTIAQKDLSKLTPEEFEGSYSKETDKKTYKSLTDFENKYKGSKGLTVKVGGTLLTKKDIDKVEPKGDGTKVGDNKYYTKESTTITGGAVSTTASIKVTGKGNYTGTLTISEQAVSIQPQRLNIGSISGATVTFGSIGSLLDGLTVDDYTELTGSTAKDKVKPYKFTSSSKNIKIKDGEVTVKKIDGETEANNTITVTITNKKNGDCVGEVTFKVAPMDISTGSSLGLNMFDTTGVYGKTNNKVYKNFVEFMNKFIGKDVEKAKGAGLKLAYPNPKDTNKSIKLKVNKDYKVTFTPNGTKSTKTEEGNFKQTAYYTNNGTEVTTTGTLVIEGIGNYAGIITDDAFKVPLEYQCITASSLGAKTGCSVTFRGETKNIYDYIAVDLSDKSVADEKLTDLNKKFKVKPATKDLSVDKDGNIKVKSVPDSGECTINITLKKNAKSIDGVHALKVKINPAIATDKSLAIVFDKAGFEGKSSYKSKDDAEKAAKKIKVKSTIDGKSKALKAGKDYESPITVKAISEGTTGSAFKFELSATFKGNYTGTVTDSAVCKIP